jgi:hypothetical protein
MSTHDAEQKKLFVCTKPYQYLICRLIKEGFAYDRADLLVLNHFDDAKQFTDSVEKLGIWNRVFFEDDAQLNRYNAQLNLIQKFFFYHDWKRLLPSCIEDYMEYNKLYFAHDGVAMEYGLMRKFADQGKPCIIYEEGIGNYVSTNHHIGVIKRSLKEIAHWFGIPGSYIGRLKYVNKILLQRPDSLDLDKSDPIRGKIFPLPFNLKDFLVLSHIERELLAIYPMLNDLSENVPARGAIGILLGESWWDALPNRDEYLNRRVREIQERYEADLGAIFIKQHPGETNDIINLAECFKVIPRNLPIELLYNVIRRRRPTSILLFTFESTAALNLYLFLSGEKSIAKIVVLRDSRLDPERVLSNSRFEDLLNEMGIRYSVLDIKGV